MYFGGSSPVATETAAQYTDVYLTWVEPPAQVAEKIGRGRAPAARQGRTVRFGIRLHVIPRDTAGQAWAEANRLLDGFAPATVAQIQAGLARSESEGQQRMLALHGGGNRDGPEIHPNLWAGTGLVCGGAGTALAGSHDDVAGRIKEYHALGIGEFVLSGYPHLEEAYWFGEGVLPRLAAQGLWHTRTTTGAHRRRRPRSRSRADPAVPLRGARGRPGATTASRNGIGAERLTGVGIVATVFSFGPDLIVSGPARVAAVGAATGAVTGR